MFPWIPSGTQPTYTALHDVARMYPRVSWVIEGDIVGCFDNIPHNGLLTAVARRIADGKVLGLVSAFLRQDTWSSGNIIKRTAGHHKEE